MSGTRWTAAALFLAAICAACADKEPAAELQPAADPGDLDAVEIESEAEAWERASETIDLENFDEQLEALEAEIESDPYTGDGG